MTDRKRTESQPLPVALERDTKVAVSRDFLRTLQSLHASERVLEEAMKAVRESEEEAREPAHSSPTR
jgi:hypothetical protein